MVEAISSILPICDEFVVNVGTSDDDTLDLVRTISSTKLKIIEHAWDLSLRRGGELLSTETNRALAACQGDWCFYLQADEVLHEKYLNVVHNEMEKEMNNSRGLKDLNSDTNIFTEVMIIIRIISGSGISGGSASFGVSRRSYRGVTEWIFVTATERCSGRNVSMQKFITTDGFARRKRWLQKILHFIRCIIPMKRFSKI